MPATSAAPPVREDSTGKSTLLGGPVEDLPAVNDRGWNVFANSGVVPAALVWWLVLVLLSLGAWPLVFGVARALPDRGYLLAKAVGWLGVGYVLWLGASARLLSNRVGWAWALLGLLLGAGALAAWRQRAALRAFVGARRWLLLREELLFTGAFAVFVLIRALNPDLWQPWFGGEKMMEYAYLNAITKSAHFPPYDPYFAGGTINYYYYGLYLVNVLIKLTGIVPQIAFNLAVPTFFALTVGEAFALGHALTCRVRGRRWLWGGLAAAAGVALLANLNVLVQWLASLISIGGGTAQPDTGLEAMGPLLTGLGRWLTGHGALQSFDYWYLATRIIPNTINEFPFFSFLFADLHPHMMDIPFTIATLVILAALLLDGRQGRRKWPAAALIVLALTVGALGAQNTWDLPAFLGLAVLTLVWLSWARGSGLWGTLQALAVAGLAYELYRPFYAHYLAPSASPQIDLARTPLRNFVVVWGVWLVALAGWLGQRWWRGRQGARRMAPLFLGQGAARRRRLLVDLGWRFGGRTYVRWVLPLLGLTLGLFFLLAGQAVVAVLMPLAAWAADLWLRQDAPQTERFAGLLALVGLAILAGIEFVYLADFLNGSDWRRMNTVFKFGIQAWVLLALAVAAGLPAVLAWLRAPGRKGKRVAWASAMAVCLAVSFAYVPMGTLARVTERFPGGEPPVGTLDGLAYMRNGVYYWPDSDHPIVLSYDYDAIQWLLVHVQGTPVLAEAPLGYYREGGMRVASYTGLPGLVGMHQVEQRPVALVYERNALAERLFQSEDGADRLRIIVQLDVRYIYFGQLERTQYGEASRAVFEGLVQDGKLEVAYQNPGVTIFRVVE